MSELLKFKLLPATLINTNFVKGNPDSNYEKNPKVKYIQLLKVNTVGNVTVYQSIIR